ncbi:hypothetical protein FQA39_LY09286 [Lamprigera yunnana]|nr:hypothetical protein FQA39_LY09286 [Lamprigera yunnana]
MLTIINDKLSEILGELKETKAENREMRETISRLEGQIVTLERETRKRNLIFKVVEEKGKESTEDWENQIQDRHLPPRRDMTQRTADACCPNVIRRSTPQAQTTCNSKSNSPASEQLTQQPLTKFTTPPQQPPPQPPVADAATMATLMQQQKQRPSNGHSMPPAHTAIKGSSYQQGNMHDAPLQHKVSSCQGKMLDAAEPQRQIRNARRKDLPNHTPCLSHAICLSREHRAGHTLRST